MPRLPRWRIGRRRPGPEIWGGRAAMLVLFGSLILALTSGFIYTASQALLPTTPEGIAASARNRCTPLYEVESKAWFDCLSREPPPPSEDALPFLQWGVGTALLGLVLVVIAARGNPRAAIPAFVAAWVLAMGMVRVDSVQEDERRMLERLRAEAGDLLEDDPEEEDAEAEVEAELEDDEAPDEDAGGET